MFSFKNSPVKNLPWGTISFWCHQTSICIENATLPDMDILLLYYTMAELALLTKACVWELGNTCKQKRLRGTQKNCSPWRIFNRTIFKGKRKDDLFLEINRSYFFL